METLRLVLLAIHLLSWAFVVGAWASRLRTPVPIAKGVWHAAATALVTGLLLVGVREMDDLDVNHVKIGIKLVVAIVVTVLAFVATRKGDRAPVWMAHAIGGLAVLNVLIAVLWQ
ncbi:hypothetical protein KV102_10680 [Mumia sp. zg.B53]|uniref:hypothetical protein n=1 Tax=unclassified Mumia TaxID=2621872 RepID=UPI001C6E40D5|nr:MULTISPECIES: hypothetical protein [unclassified Mumia]MBW9206974.1 hypothetical protein [Mumia sp. zg.B17]MBW9215307.1 hypothetical protein [Mumia sp. zg.B53]MDD9350087.1 hypothetical protein [Mumia sp.]